MCPDMVNGGMRLRSNLKDTWSNGAETFHFAIDTCDNFKEFTGSETCQPNSVVEPLINSFTAINKIQQQFFSVKTYVSNDEKLSSEFIQKRQPLSSKILYHKSYSITPEEVQYDNTVFYSDQLINGLSDMTLYKASQVDSWSYPGSEKDTGAV